ncbi:carboxymuconolactone decarboxylase family protein [Aeromonas caviae]|uniref:hypothetical protein n=1 Tax=Aeromonas caviae TaxID=648 RepID=UPI0028DE482C|nr:hypothetical protein [Aeromonas caviae]MDT8956717.1 hypothetical protein [Aeromonas caviae]
MTTNQAAAPLTLTLIGRLNDEVTLIADKGLTTQTYEAALAQLGETLLAQCLVQVVTINAWNRIAVATRMEHNHS